MSQTFVPFVGFKEILSLNGRYPTPSNIAARDSSVIRTINACEESCHRNLYRNSGLTEVPCLLPGLQLSSSCKLKFEEGKEYDATSKPLAMKEYSTIRRHTIITVLLHQIDHIRRGSQCFLHIFCQKWCTATHA
ncbi:hypothetical protein HanRHA438_Chr07g0293251 [Helianthus annuus]|nr:hypothetical protein HanRHA438_Chr07g0293251 [Helianthus annuus]